MFLGGIYSVLGGIYSVGVYIAPRNPDLNTGCNLTQMTPLDSFKEFFDEFPGLRAYGKTIVFVDEQK